MKKIFLLLLFISCSVLFFYSCKPGLSGPAYSIKMRLNKGDTFIHDMKINMENNSSFLHMKMRSDNVIFFEVIDTNTETKTLRMTYRKMEQSMDMGAMNKLNKKSDSILNSKKNLFIGKSIVLKLSKNNQITEVAGFDELMNTEPKDSAISAMMKSMFSKDNLNNMFGIIFSMYPKNPVQVNESWTGITNMQMLNMNMQITSKYTLISVKNGLAEIGLEGDIGWNKGITKELKNVKMDMSGSQKGTIFLRMDNGYLHSAAYKIDMKMGIQMKEQKMPITMKADYTIKGI